jgi:predicted permease
MRSRLRSLWRNLAHRDRMQRDLDDEMRAMFDLLVEEKIARGMEGAAARRTAQIELGGVEPLKERIRDVKMGVLIETVWQDVRQAVRIFRRSPWFAFAAIATLALGIGANTAMFTMLNALTLKRLPIEKPDELFAIAPLNSRGLPRTTPMSAVAELQDGPLEHLCAFLGGVVFPVLANDTPVQTSTTFVTGQCFAAFGISPVIGRGITDADAPIHGPGAHVAVISHRLWSRTYHADPNILGKSMLVNHVPVTIIGVLPKGFQGLDVDHGVDIFTPFDAVLPAARGRRQLASYLLGRLRPGTTVDAAVAQIEARWPAVLQAVLPANMSPTERTQLMDSQPRLISIGTGTSRIRDQYVQPLTLVFALTASLLVLACINLGGLLMTRVNSRATEIAVRLALGGTRVRIARQLLVENLLLALSGAALGIPIAYLTAVTLVSFLPPVNVPYAFALAPDVRVFMATAAVAIAVGVFMSAIPVWFASRRQAAVPAGGDRTVAHAAGRWSHAMLATQVALAVVLLANAMLLTRSLYLLGSSDLGIKTANILTIKLWQLPNAPYNRGNREAYYPPLLEKVRALPGVTAAALAEVSPRRSTTTVGSPVAFRGDGYGDVTTSLDTISPGYFTTMGMRLLAGRDVSWQDTLQTERVGVVSQSLARALAPDGKVLGRAIHVRTLPQDLEYVIIGVVSDATMGDPRNAHPRVIYDPLLQTNPISQLNPNVILETTDPAAAAGVRQILQEFGHDYALGVISLKDLLARAPAMERMSATVAGAVSGIAVVLALIGVHGALAYSVARRTRELGVRIAIGASPSAAARRIILEAVLVSLAGIVIGLPLAAMSARSFRGLIHGITDTDPLTFVAVAIAFLVVGVVAAAGPARKAATIDPVVALRSE